MINKIISLEAICDNCKKQKHYQIKVLMEQNDVWVKFKTNQKEYETPQGWEVLNKFFDGPHNFCSSLCMNTFVNKRTDKRVDNRK